MIAELIRPVRICILLRRALFPICPFVDRRQVFCRHIVDLREHIQIHEEEMPHLMKKRRFVCRTEQANEPLAVRLHRDLAL